MRNRNIKQNSDIYPSYKLIQEAKSHLRPTGIIATETMVEVSLQNLLNPTARRIVLMQDEILRGLDIRSAKLIISYGFDGKTGHSLYKQNLYKQKPTSLDP